eukprot:CAMPEP_0118805038 /NCGR_PEP_ID=MMETSP1161-20130426/25700_1 /TAXON_ID=249345 /ORGANISM="Picochlorum oklahomensis, Strain CCMP2329" /LENGTH=45 /DNA_ID= /DNA_START= /DNA_END= /DNA_ORIENTATION=
MMTMSIITIIPFAPPIFPALFAVTDGPDATASPSKEAELYLWQTV